MTEPEIVEMTPAEEAWYWWAHSQDVDTGGKCDCGHEGLGVDWHMSVCPAVPHLIRAKLVELFGEVTDQAAVVRRQGRLIERLEHALADETQRLQIAETRVLSMESQILGSEY